MERVHAHIDLLAPPEETYFAILVSNGSWLQLEVEHLDPLQLEVVRMLWSRFVRLSQLSTLSAAFQV